MTRPKEDPIQCFLDKVEVMPNGCWNWKRIKQEIKLEHYREE